MVFIGAEVCTQIASIIIMFKEKKRDSDSEITHILTWGIVTDFCMLLPNIYSFCIFYTFYNMYNPVANERYKLIRATSVLIFKPLFSILFGIIFLVNSIYMGEIVTVWGFVTLYMIISWRYNFINWWKAKTHEEQYITDKEITQ